ncbi:MAG: AAA family ATPase [Opitutaceae bacterium]
MSSSPAPLVTLWGLRLLHLSLESVGGVSFPGIPARRAKPKDELDLILDELEEKAGPSRRPKLPRTPSRLQVAGEVAQQLGEDWDADDPAALTRLRKGLQRRILRAERLLQGRAPLEGLDPDARASVAAVGKLLDLSAPECLVLAFILMLGTESTLEVAANCLGHDLDDRMADHAVATATGLTAAEVGRVFSAHSRLMSCQLLKRDRSSLRLLGTWDWPSRGLASARREPKFDPLKALRDRVVPAPGPAMAWANFTHLGDLGASLRTYLSEALRTGRKGVNVLLHGPPGCGKTQLVRLLGRELGAEVYEVSTEDADGDPIGSGSRLQALRVAQEFTARRRALLCFDEIEDVFPRPFPFGFGGQRSGAFKGWMNRMLEQNATITFYLTNAVEALDAAYIRRFDFTLELKVPPQAAREAQLKDLPVAVAPPTLARLAEHPQLTPAVIQRAAGVVAAVTAATPGLDASRQLEALVNQTLRAQGHSTLKAHAAAPEVYDPRFINSDVNPVDLVEGLRTAGAGRLCLYGPPGTGKTAFALHLARSLGRGLLVRRASDLLSPFVGVAEKQIAAAFREAGESGAVLLIDEVDSFLQDRSRAQRNWEVTEVNEFLTQMESFTGIFVASTNLISGFDPAALRRFDLKAKFDHLRPEQAVELLGAHLAAAGLPAAGTELAGGVGRVRAWARGDFAGVARQHRFRPLRSPDDWAAALEAECRHKPGANPRPTIGFGGVAA